MVSWCSECKYTNAPNETSNRSSVTWRACRLFAKNTAMYRKRGNTFSMVPRSPQGNCTHEGKEIVRAGTSGMSSRARAVNSEIFAYALLAKPSLNLSNERGAQCSFFKGTHPSSVRMGRPEWRAPSRNSVYCHIGSRHTSFEITKGSKQSPLISPIVSWAAWNIILFFLG